MQHTSMYMYVTHFDKPVYVLLSLSLSLSLSLPSFLLLCIQVEKKIGQGQFSVVYRAKNLVTGQIVALKKIQIFDMVDAKARQDCIKEIDLLKVAN